MNDTPGWPALEHSGDDPARRPRIEVRRSRRRTRTASAYRDGDGIVVLLPGRVSRAEGERLTDELVHKVLARESRAAGADLAGRAARLSKRYLEPELGRAPLPATIEWVTNQNQRWGSCTVADRSIRLSHRMQGMPGWVVDYVILHELAHLVYADHSARFWRLLDAYPRLERARGYLEGYQAGAAYGP